MTKFYKLILVCCAALFLTACAHPDMIKLNDTYDHTVKELGVPDSTRSEERRVGKECRL